MKYFRWKIALDAGCKGSSEASAMDDALSQIDVAHLHNVIDLEEITEEEYHQTNTGEQDPD